MRGCIPQLYREIHTFTRPGGKAYPEVIYKKHGYGDHTTNEEKRRNALWHRAGLRHLHTGTEQDQPRVSPWNVANMITCGRILVAPVIGYWIANGEYDVALCGLTYAAISDWTDGILARKFKLHTVLGSYLDPAADKLLIMIATITLTWQSIIPVWLTSLIVGRDIVLVGGWLALIRNRHPQASLGNVFHTIQNTAMEPLLISKLNTTFQIALAFGGVLNAGEWSFLSDESLHNIGLATALTTTASGISYGQRFWARWNRL